MRGPTLVVRRFSSSTSWATVAQSLCSCSVHDALELRRRCRDLTRIPSPVRDTRMGSPSVMVREYGQLMSWTVMVAVGPSFRAFMGGRGWERMGDGGACPVKWWCVFGSLGPGLDGLTSTSEGLQPSLGLGGGVGRSEVEGVGCLVSSAYRTLRGSHVVGLTAGAPCTRTSPPSTPRLASLHPSSRSLRCGGVSLNATRRCRIVEDGVRGVGAIGASCAIKASLSALPITPNGRCRTLPGALSAIAVGKVTTSLLNNTSSRGPPPPPPTNPPATTISPNIPPRHTKTVPEKYPRSPSNLSKLCTSSFFFHKRLPAYSLVRIAHTAPLTPESVYV